MLSFHQKAGAARDPAILVHLEQTRNGRAQGRV